MQGRFVGRMAAGVLGLACVSGLWACGGDDGTAPEAAPDAITIVMTNETFDPRVDTVAVGGTVTWRNDDDFDHNTIADGGAWSSQNFGQGATFEHTFAAAGSYPYHCALHEGMTGTIVAQ